MAQWISAYPAPLGEETNLIDPPDQLAGNIACHAVLLTLVTGLVALRTYTRIHITKASFGVEDYLCLWCWCLTCAFSGLMLKSFSLGIGRDIWNEPAAWLIDALKFFTFGQYVYIVLSGSIKLVFLFFYLRIFAKDRKRAAIYGGIAVIAIINIGTFFATIFDCTPVEKAWNPLLPGHCINPVILPWFQGATSVATDVYVLVLPVPFLWGLHVDAGRKRRLVVVFSVGLFICATSIIRLIETPILFGANATSNLSKISLWATLEVNVGIICSCLMFLPAFADRHIPASLKSSLSSIWTRDRQTGRSSVKPPSHSQPPTWDTYRGQKLESESNLMHEYPVPVTNMSTTRGYEMGAYTSQNFGQV